MIWSMWITGSDYSNLVTKDIMEPYIIVSTIYMQQVILNLEAIKLYTIIIDDHQQNKSMGDG